MRKTLVLMIFLLTMIGAFSIAQWGRLAEWWQSLPSGKRTAYTGVLYCAVTVIAGRFVALNPLLILAALILLRLISDRIRIVLARHKK